MTIGELTLNQVREICTERVTCEGCELAFEYNSEYNNTPNTCCLLHHKCPEVWRFKYLQKEIKG